MFDFNSCNSETSKKSLWFLYFLTFNVGFSYRMLGMCTLSQIVTISSWPKVMCNVFVIVLVVLMYAIQIQIGKQYKNTKIGQQYILITLILLPVIKC